MLGEDSWSLFLLSAFFSFPSFIHTKNALHEFTKELLFSLRIVQFCLYGLITAVLVLVCSCKTVLLVKLYPCHEMHLLSFSVVRIAYTLIFRVKRNV